MILDQDFAALDNHFDKWRECLVFKGDLALPQNPQKWCSPWRRGSEGELDPPRFWIGCLPQIFLAGHIQIVKLFVSQLGPRPDQGTAPEINNLQRP